MCDLHKTHCTVQLTGISQNIVYKGDGTLAKELVWVYNGSLAFAYQPHSKFLNFCLFLSGLYRCIVHLNVYRFHIIGVVLIFIHDIGDVFLEGSKSILYFKEQDGKMVKWVETCANVGFLMFAAE